MLSKYLSAQYVRALSDLKYCSCCWWVVVGGWLTKFDFSLLALNGE